MADSEKRPGKWQWNNNVADHLILKLEQNNNEMNYMNIDFNRDVFTVTTTSSLPKDFAKMRQHALIVVWRFATRKQIRRIVLQLL